MSDDKKCDYMMKVKELSFSYGKNRILNNISLKIPEGRITTILGANGCGKSTLFSLMTKNLVPDRGRIFCREKISAVCHLESLLSVFPSFTSTIRLPLT